MFFKDLPVKEKDIEREICDYLAAKGYFFWKNVTGGFYDSSRQRFRKHSSPYALNGAPDVICIIGGVFCGFEIKSKTGRLSDAQDAFRARVLGAGGYYFVIRCVKDLTDALKAVTKVTPKR